MATSSSGSPNDGRGVDLAIFTGIWTHSFGHLEDDVASVAHHLRPDLDQLLLQARQRPVLDRLRCCKRAEKVAKIVGERMKLEPPGVGRERPARQPCPLDRALAFLDPLLARPALVIERNDPLGRAAHIRHDEADAADTVRPDAIRPWRSPGAAWSSFRPDS